MRALRRPRHRRRPTGSWATASTASRPCSRSRTSGSRTASSCSARARRGGARQLAWADVFVHPSLTEGFGVAVIEAQAMGASGRLLGRRRPARERRATASPGSSSRGATRRRSPTRLAQLAADPGCAPDGARRRGSARRRVLTPRAPARRLRGSSTDACWPSRRTRAPVPPAAPAARRARRCRQCASSRARGGDAAPARAAVAPRGCRATSRVRGVRATRRRARTRRKSRRRRASSTSRGSGASTSRRTRTACMPATTRPTARRRSSIC